MGLTHATLNSVAVALYAGIVVGPPAPGRAGTLLALAGMAVATGAGYLGGHLIYTQGVGVDTNSFHSGPGDWEPVSAVEDIPADGGRAVVAGRTRLLLFRRGSQVGAIENRCSHRGGPLVEGTIGRRLCHLPMARQPLRPRDRRGALGSRHRGSAGVRDQGQRRSGRGQAARGAGPQGQGRRARLRQLPFPDGVRRRIEPDPRPVVWPVAVAYVCTAVSPPRPASDERLDRGHLLASAHETGPLDRQVVTMGVQRPQRGELGGQVGMAQLVEVLGPGQIVELMAPQIGQTGVFWRHVLWPEHRQFRGIREGPHAKSSATLPRIGLVTSLAGRISWRATQSGGHRRSRRSG